ncbi:glucosamine-6-phosphate deaminase [Paenibacillus sp. RC67]|uniref:glucosamine-6-phosphate deaminase n=1 Tax=Paenibacillus sp. RC67 TaxID=3039392 RepID=UPI0024ADE822|nr:glucosamine-6-phosphate deaminase [Paenibacillus sp. RC67]
MRSLQLPESSFAVDQLKVEVYRNRRELGEAAAAAAAEAIRARLRSQANIRIVFAAAPSQNEFLDRLCEEPDIDWSRVTAFHMDEYIGLAPDAPERFSHYLDQRFFDKISLGQVHYIDGSNDVEEECARYTDLLREVPLDLVCLGIGENGHIAFNDPPVADFEDPHTIKCVELDEACRQQQVNDGCFPDLASVPTHALTLTISALFAGAQLFCMVPGPTKRAAVQATLTAPVSTACPASILRRHPSCVLYVDSDSYGG